MTRKSVIKILAATLLTALLLCTVAAVIIPRVLDLDSHKTRILATLEKSLNRQVSYDTASFSRQLVPELVIRGLTIKEKTGDTNLLTVDKLTFRLALLPLLHKEVRLGGIVFDRPVLMLARNHAGVFSISDFFAGEPSAYDFHVSDIQIRNGLIRFTDQLSPDELLMTSLEKLDLQVNGMKRGGGTEFKFSTVIQDQGGRAELSLAGNAGIPPPEVPFTETRLEVVFSVKNLDAGRYWPYYGRFLPFERVQGRLDMEAGAFKGRLKEFTTKGSLSLRDLRLNYPAVFRSLLTPKKIDLDYDLELTSRKLTAKSLDLRIDGLQFKGSGDFDDIHGNDPHLNVRLSSSPFRFADVQSYIPYGVIPGGTAAFIEQHIKGGTFRVSEGRLDGRLSQIRHMDQGTNYNALFIRATVDKGLMTFGPQVPLISAIKGGLEFRGKDFILSGMTGRFGGSQFSLDGKIADYPLKTTVSYPFTLSMTPTRTEVAWLLAQREPGQMDFSGPSQLRLTGVGTADNFRLSGAWDLSRTDYRFAQLIRKPVGLTNRIWFSAVLGRAEARLTELRYQLPPLDVTASAIYRYDDKVPLSLAVATDQFDVSGVLSVFPLIDPYDPRGRLQAAVSATGNPARSDSFQWQGGVTLTELSFRPVAQISPVNHLNGAINISGTALETEQLTGKLGNSDFTVKGSLSRFANPVVNLDLSFPELHLHNLGYLAPEQDPVLKNLAAKVSLQDGHLAIASLTGQVNRSSFGVQGDLLDFKNPKISLRVKFPFLRAEDLLLLTGLKPADESVKKGSVALKVQVEAAAGTVRDIPFTKLAAELSLQNSLLVMQGATLGILGGTVSGSGKAELDSVGGPAYQAQYRLERVDAAQLLKAAGGEPAVTGQLIAAGELTAKGNSPEELKKTARVAADIELNSGKLLIAATNGKEKNSEVPFKAVQGSISFEKSLLTAQSVRIDIFDGTVFAHGAADFTANHEPGYQASFHMESIDAAQLDAAFGFQSDFTGRLGMEGELAARGDNPDALRKSAQGSFEIHFEKGVINKFGFVSKIFSILNVSQLFAFRLPDMVSVGMPYNSIDGSFSVKDGSLSTSDLALDSPSINITVVGKTDIVKKEIDLLCAVQPLQTISMIISRIPVFGWLLTGGNKRFLVSYYEAKGNWNDPTVTGRNISELPGGVYNIFKRVYSLPEKMFTDTGKVFMGN